MGHNSWTVGDQQQYPPICGHRMVSSFGISTDPPICDLHSQMPVDLMNGLRLEWNPKKKPGLQAVL